MRMPPMQRAAYIDLMANQWLEGPFTLEVALMVSRGVPEKEVKAVLQSKFIQSDGLYYNERLEQERKKQIANSDKQSRNGKKGGRPPKNDKPKINPTDNPNETQIDSQLETQTEARKKLSDSDSDSVLVLESNSNSDSVEEDSHRHHGGYLSFVPTDGDLSVWEHAYPSLDVRSEIAKALAKFNTIGRGRDGVSAFRKYVNNWLQGQEDRIKSSPSKNGPRCPQVDLPKESMFAQ